LKALEKGFNMARDKLKIRKDDLVVVLSGDDKGKVGRVLRVIPQESRVVVESVRMVKRHVKAQGDQPGTRIEKEAPIHISNVAVWNSDENKKVRVGFRTETVRTDDGKETSKKVRINRKTGARI